MVPAEPAERLAITRLPYYPALTGLRAVAAYALFFYHFRPSPIPDWVGWLMKNLYVGVGLFFVLSGFVIASRYQGRVRLTRPWWRGYLWHRVARIYPSYFLLNGIMLAFHYCPVPPGQAVRSALLVFISQSLLRGFSNTLKFVGLPQGWTLTVEECFYLTAPLLLVAWQRWGTRGALAFGLAVVSTGLVITYLCQGYPALHGLFGSYYHLFNYTFFGRVLEFGMGVALARWWAARPEQPAASRPWRTLAGGLLMAAALVLLAGLNSPFDWYEGLRYPTAIALNNIVFPAGVVLLLAGLLTERSWLRAGLSTLLLQALGRSSYFFYLLHLSFFSVWWAGRFGKGGAPGWQFLATILLAYAGYRWFEEPTRRWVLLRVARQDAARKR